MSKATKKKRNIYNQDIAQKHNTIPQYVRQCVRGERASDLSEKIKKEYKTLDKKAKEALNQ
jgi:hypothetical protein